MMGNGGVTVVHAWRVGVAFGSLLACRRSEHYYWGWGKGRLGGFKAVSRLAVLLDACVGERFA